MGIRGRFDEGSGHRGVGVMGSSSLKMEEGGHEPQNVGSFKRLEKARKWILLYGWHLDFS